MSSKTTPDTEPVAQDEKEAEAKEEAKDEEKVEEMAPLQQLFYFCMHADVEGIKAIAPRIDINANDDLGTKNQPYITRNTALHYAVLSGSLDTVRVIYNLEAKINATNKLKCTPLHLAASLGYTEIVQFLIEMAADIEAKNIIENTPLHCAVYAGHVDTVKAILGNVDDIRQSLMLPVNGVGFGPVKYTAHDDMKQYLKQYFPKKIKANEDKEAQNKNSNYQKANIISSANDHRNGNDVQEEDIVDDIDETTGLTSTEQ